MLLSFFSGFQGTTYNQNLDPSLPQAPFFGFRFFVSKYPIISLYWTGFLWFSYGFSSFPFFFCLARRCALLLIHEAGCCRSSNPRLQLVSTNWGDSTNSFFWDMSLKGYLYIYTISSIYIYIYISYVPSIYYMYVYIYISTIYIYSVYIYSIYIYVSYIYIIYYIYM